MPRKTKMVKGVTGPQLAALGILLNAGAKGARGSRDTSVTAPAPWTDHTVNTRAAKALVARGFARTWEALPDGAVVDGEDLVRCLGLYSTRFAITTAGRRAVG